jgi:hypothetical protein
MRPLLWLLILSASATLQAQTFEVDYLYRAPGKPNHPKRVFGVITLDSAKKSLTFTSSPKDQWGRRQPMLKFDITASAATNMTYEHESAPPGAGNDGGLVTTVLLAGLTARADKAFVTLHYKTTSGEGRYAIFHFEKSKDVREALAAIEAALGIR